jgi:hypothetical protein
MSCRLAVCAIIVLLDAVHKEQALAYLVVPATVFLITIKTQSEAMAFLLLGLVEAADGTTFDGRRGHRCSGRLGQD